MNRKVMIDNMASIYRVMPIFVAPVLTGVQGRYPIRPRTSKEPDASVET